MLIVAPTLSCAAFGLGRHENRPDGDRRSGALFARPHPECPIQV